MAETKATLLNNWCQRNRIELKFEYESKTNQEGIAVWYATFSVDERSWTGDGCPSKKEARENVARQALPHLTDEISGERSGGGGVGCGDDGGDDG